MINKIGITITMKNCVDYTKKCLESFNRSDVQMPHHFILIDHGSKDGTKKFLAQLGESFKQFLESIPEKQRLTKGLTIISDPDVDSLAALWNMGMAEAERRDCQANLVCNNDILFSDYTVKGVVDRMNKAIAENENIGMVTASNLRRQISPENIENITKPVEVNESDSPDFSCFLMRIDVWKQMGKFDENYVPCYFEDNDTHTIFKIMDIRAIRTTAAPYYHFGSRTQNSVQGGLCKPPQFTTNHKYFMNKFGMDPVEVDQRLDELKEKFKDATVSGFNEKYSRKR